LRHCSINNDSLTTAWALIYASGTLSAVSYSHVNDLAELLRVSIVIYHRCS